MTDLHSLTGVYALDALDEDERREFEQHLEACEACEREVREFRTVTARLAASAEVPPPPSLRSAVMRATAESGPAQTVQWATRELLAARTRQDVVDTVLAVVERLGGWTVPADLADQRALHMDVGFGIGAPLLPVAELASQARRDLEHNLPQLVEDAHQTLERLHRTERDAEDRAGSSGFEGRSR